MSLIIADVLSLRFLSAFAEPVRVFLVRSNRGITEKFLFDQRRFPVIRAIKKLNNP